MIEENVPYSVIDVTSWKVERQETIGADEKYWLAEPDSDSQWLFKPNIVHVHPRSGEEWSQREDISEKVAGEIAKLLRIPCASIEFAIWKGKAGCISRNLRPEGWELQTGLVLLSGMLDDYIPGTEITNKTRRGHSLQTIRAALEGYGKPEPSDLPEDFDAFDTFAGYVTFDAVVANRDRHDENWAVMRPLRGGQGTLAGSFDHARALGSTLRDEALQRELVRGIDRWARRGTAWRFEHDEKPGPVTLVELAGQALHMVRPTVRSWWLTQVEAVTPEDAARINSRVPKMSYPASTFIEQVFATNRRRVLDDC